MAHADIPARPAKGEIAPPEVTLGGGGAWDLTERYRDFGLGSDPRHWQADPAGVTAATAALADPHARAVLDQRLDAVVAAPLEITPGGTMRRDRMAAGDLEEQLGALEIDRISRELLHAAWHGYAIAECLWEIEGPAVRLADLRVRNPARFRWHRDGDLRLITRGRPGGVVLPPAKFCVLVQPRQHGGQAHGPGAAEWCVWPVWLKRHVVSMWAVALERFGTPTTCMTLAGDASSAAIEKALAQQAALVGGAGLVLKEGHKIELLESGRRAGGDYAEFVRAMDAMIADAVLGERATSEIGQWQATAEAHADVLQRLVAADARRLSAMLRHSVATWLTAWNFPGAAVPHLSRNTAPPEDLAARAARDVQVAAASGLRLTQPSVEETYGGIWEPDPRQAAPASPGPPAAGPGAGPGAALAAAREPPARDAVDAAVDRLVGESGWEALMDPVLTPPGVAVAEAHTPDALAAALDAPDLYAAMDTNPMAARLARATTSARLSAEGDDGAGRDDDREGGNA